MPLLYLNSRDQNVVYDSNQNIEWTITDPRLNSLGPCTVTLVNMEVPNVVYPVNEYYNSVQFTESGGSTYTATVADGYYTGSALATALATAMTNTASSRTYTGSFSSTTYKITISVDSGTFMWVDVDNALYNDLGITEFAATNASQVSDAPVQLQGTNFIDVVCSELPSTNVTASDDSKRVLARIPIDQNFGNIIFFQPNVGQAIPVSIDGLSTLTIALYDDRGNPWSLPLNAHLSLCLSIEPQMDSRATTGTLANPDYSVSGADLYENISFRY